MLKGVRLGIACSQILVEMMTIMMMGRERKQTCK